MPNPLAHRAPWKQLLVLSIGLPVIVMAAVLAFAWPSARIQPRSVPVGVVGSSSASQVLISGLDHAQPGGFDVHLYASQEAAMTALGDRDIYGAFVVTPQHLTVMEASAASPSVAQLLTTAGDKIAALASQTATSAGGPAIKATVVDVVALSSDDPRGVVLSAALLPLTICSILLASAIGLVVRLRPAWRQIVALLSVSAIAALGVYLIAQSWLGALPHEPVATWAGLALTILAISSTTAGLIALAGTAGFAVSAALMVFIGNPFSGVTSAPELLPGAVRSIGRALPPGAGANLLRSTAYFDGNGSSGHLAVLIAWIVGGWAAVVVGHHAPIRFAANSQSPVGRTADDRDLDSVKSSVDSDSGRGAPRLFRPLVTSDSSHDHPRHLLSDEASGAPTGRE